MNGKGFTLTELMITIAIVGILIGVAVPSYQEYLRQSRRSDARISLDNLAAAQETHYFQNNKYATKFSALKSVAESVVAIPSEQGFYSITMVADDFSWSMSAAAVGGQAEDTHCALFTITHLGVQNARDVDGVVTSKCW